MKTYGINSYQNVNAVAVNWNPNWKLLYSVEISIIAYESYGKTSVVISILPTNMVAFIIYA